MRVLRQDGRIGPVGRVLGQVKPRALGGDVSVIITGFDPAFLADGLRTVHGQHVTFEVKQNTLSTQRSCVIIRR